MRRTDAFPHVADVMVNSAYDPATGAVHAFEEQIGSHGGLGGDQGRPFLMWPTELSDPDPERPDPERQALERPDPERPDPFPGQDQELVGAEAVHAVLRRWLREADGPQVPVDPPVGGSAAEPAGRPVEEPPPRGGNSGSLPSAGVPARDEIR